MLIGEAPGANENEQGIPFVGRSGELLDKLLKWAEVERATIINTVACKPPMNRNPKRLELKACWPRVSDLIQAAEPRAIVSVGRVATDWLLASYAKRTEVGTACSLAVGQFTTTVIPTYHPAYLLRKHDDELTREVVSHLHYALGMVEETSF